MITRFHVENYKALRDVTLNLTPIHVLIGPNDSGKTSLLEAIGALSRSVDVPLAEAFLGAWKGPRLVWNQREDLNVTFSVELVSGLGAFSGSYELSVAFHPTERQVFRKRELFQGDAPYPANLGGHSFVSMVLRHNFACEDQQRRECREVQMALSGCSVARWTGRMLALPCALNPNRQFQIDPSGFGLASCLDDIMGDRGGRFERIENRFRNYFPQVRSIKLRQTEAYDCPYDAAANVPQLNKTRGKGVFFEFVDGGDDIAADQVSEGMLLVLAYLTILNLQKPPRLLLVEEPENGIHPRRLADILTILKELVAEQKQCQVILTTHSPYVLDHFQPEEVTLCRKGSDGDICVRRLSESQTVNDQKDIFTLGEIWAGEGDEALMEKSSEVMALP